MSGTRAALEESLRGQGRALDVETDADGSPVTQYFHGQFGPYPNDTPVAILRREDAEAAIAEIDTLRAALRGLYDAYVGMHTTGRQDIATKQAARQAAERALAPDSETNPAPSSGTGRGEDDGK